MKKILKKAPNPTAKELYAVEELKQEFKSLGFSALNFTDSRGVFQFYNLANLWNDIQTALENDIRLLNIATEPICVAEIFKRITERTFNNQILQNPPFYDYRSKHAEVFGGQNGYFADKNTVLGEIVEFVKRN